MAEGVVDQLKDAPKAFVRVPWMALGIVALGLFGILLIEAYKPGVITGPFKKLLSAVGVGGKA